MGEVYQATDTNLKRQVAIKVLPDSLSADAERLARFQREAEVLAALNHPNIAHVYGLERAEGTTGLVMELVEGPTLADRIASGAIPIPDALAIARQIADALEAAQAVPVSSCREAVGAPCFAPRGRWPATICSDVHDDVHYRRVATILHRRSPIATSRHRRPG